MCYQLKGERASAPGALGMTTRIPLTKIIYYLLISERVEGKRGGVHKHLANVLPSSSDSTASPASATPPPAASISGESRRISSWVSSISSQLVITVVTVRRVSKMAR